MYFQRHSISEVNNVTILPPRPYTPSRCRFLVQGHICLFLYYDIDLSRDIVLPFSKQMGSCGFLKTDDSISAHSRKHLRHDSNIFISFGWNRTATATGPYEVTRLPIYYTVRSRIYSTGRNLGGRAV
jgi:hypothetical protein